MVAVARSDDLTCGGNQASLTPTGNSQLTPTGNSEQLCSTCSLELLWVKDVAQASDGGGGSGTKYRVEQRWNQATVTTTGKSEQLCSTGALCAQP